MCFSRVRTHEAVYIAVESSVITYRGVHQLRRWAARNIEKDAERRPARPVHEQQLVAHLELGQHRAEATQRLAAQQLVIVPLRLSRGGEGVVRIGLPKGKTIGMRTTGASLFGLPVLSTCTRTASSSTGRLSSKPSLVRAEGCNARLASAHAACKLKRWTIGATAWLAAAAAPGGGAAAACSCGTAGAGLSQQGCLSLGECVPRTGG